VEGRLAGKSTIAARPLMFGTTDHLELPFTRPPNSAGFENELVTNTMHGLEVNGMGRIRLKFLTQAQHLVIDSTGARIAVETPDLVQQFISRDYPLWIRYEELEEFELQSGEEDWNIRAADLHAQEVNADGAEPHNRLLKRS
jgi:hypothetical protein